MYQPNFVAFHYTYLNWFTNKTSKYFEFGFRNNHSPSIDQIHQITTIIEQALKENIYAAIFLDMYISVL